ncbi:MAG: sugar phosphate isomerase/epimerase family protein [Pseudomonadota bacterium]
MLPILGAALRPEELAAHHNWLREKPRDLELQGFHGADVEGADVKAKAAEVRPLLEGMEGRIGMHGPFRGFPLDSEDPEVRGVVHRRLDEGLDACGWLGATQMVVHSPVKAWYHENLENRDDGWESFLHRVDLTLRPALQRAEGMGIELVMENIEDRDPSARVRLVENLASPALKVSIDTGHAAYAHGIGSAPAVDRYVRAAGNLLTHVHVQDTDHFADRHWAIGDGGLPWGAIFGELAKLSSNPRLIIEIRDKAAVQRSATWLAERGLAQ